ncbi:MAG: CoA pyrophosphatase [Deltaproteobacteria bacterium]|nr:CoA pyrophosphatase [Deltaproteobacteria bacterium]
MEEKLRELLSQRKRNLIKDNNLRPSAVLVPLFAKSGERHILFIKRSQEVKDHKGEISFPGGLWEKSDERLEKTALREALEEIGIRPTDVKILGLLDDINPHPYPFTINRVEVDEIIEIPLNHLIDKGNSVKETITRDGVTYTGQVYHYMHYLIWGATARILSNLFEVLIRTL